MTTTRHSIRLFRSSRGPTSTLYVAIALAVPALAGPMGALAQESADKQRTGGRTEVNGMQMYYAASGQGDSMIVLHGAYMNIPTMGEIIPKLAETHRVYALEFQGHGRTTDIDRPITYQNLADDV